MKGFGPENPELNKSESTLRTRIAINTYLNLGSSAVCVGGGGTKTLTTIHFKFKTCFCHFQAKWSQAGY